MAFGSLLVLVIILGGSSFLAGMVPMIMAMSRNVPPSESFNLELISLSEQGNALHKFQQLGLGFC